MKGSPVRFRASALNTPFCGVGACELRANRAYRSSGPLGRSSECRIPASVTMMRWPNSSSIHSPRSTRPLATRAPITRHGTLSALFLDVGQLARRDLAPVGHRKLAELLAHGRVIRGPPQRRDAGPHQRVVHQALPCTDVKVQRVVINTESAISEQSDRRPGPRLPNGRDRRQCARNRDVHLRQPAPRGRRTSSGRGYVTPGRDEHHRNGLVRA